MQNPLISPFSSPFETPPFDKIKPEHFIPAFKEAMKTGRSEIKSIIESDASPSFCNTIEALEKSGKGLNRISSVFFNLNSAETSEKIQAIAREVSPMLTEYANDIWLNTGLFKKVKQIYQQKTLLRLTDEQSTLLDKTYKGFVRRGALLNETEKKRYREITAGLSKLSVQFGENLLAETNDYHLHITNPDDLRGLPEAVIETAAQHAYMENKKGWLFSLQAPSFLPFMKYADNRELREKFFKAFTSRCNRNNQHDNKQNIIQQVHLRMEKARLLGYKSHAHYVLEERMAQTPDKVMSLLNNLYEKAWTYAKKDVDEVIKFARKNGLSEPFQRWDFAYYSEKLKTSVYQLDEEMIKPYLQLTNVKQGIFKLTERLWGLSYRKNSSIPLYHQDVEAYEVYDQNGSFLSVLYLDFHPRKSKQGGAWMTSFRDQHQDENHHIPPQISVVCNFTEPSASRPSLLTYNELTTFLHEFGHALHGMMSKVTYESLSGTNVYHDFVELPSQIMENWAREKEWLQEIAIHYQTGESISEELIDRIVAASNFQTGYQTIRQLGFGFNDMAWHTITQPINTDPVSFEKTALSKTELLPVIEGSCISTAFGHIFDGGYASGYYGYKWAEVLDADAYSLFRENGIFNQPTAQKFRENILSKGGTIHPMDLYIQFRGKEPTIDPLLERSGLK